MSETDAGGELTVDHYQPVSAGGDDSDDNLVYACWRCNLHKSDFWPNAQQAANGLRVLHPLRDDPAQHLTKEVNGRLEALTSTGRVHLTVLQLNRMPLIAHRLRAKETAYRQTQDLLIAAAIQLQAQRIQVLSSYLVDLNKAAIDETNE